MHIGDGNIDKWYEIEVFYDKARVFEHRKRSEVYKQGKRKYGLSFFCVLIFVKRHSRGVVYKRACEEQYSIKLFSPCVENEREQYQNVIFQLKLRH